MADYPKPICPTPRCRDCAVDMQFGFMPDLAYGQMVIQRWIPGDPKPSWSWGDFSVRQYRSDSLLTISYRCPKCYRLETFAPPVLS